MGFPTSGISIFELIDAYASANGRHRFGADDQTTSRIVLQKHVLRWDCPVDMEHGQYLALGFTASSVRNIVCTIAKMQGNGWIVSRGPNIGQHVIAGYPSHALGAAIELCEMRNWFSRSAV